MQQGHDLEIQAYQNIVYAELTPYTFKQVLPLLRSLKLYAPTDVQCGSSLITSIGKMLGSYELYENGDISLKDFHILFELLKEYGERVRLVPGFKVALLSPSISVESVLFPEAELTRFTEGYETKLSDEVTIKIPKEAIDMAKEQGIGSPRLRITAYDPGLFFHWRDKENKTTTDTLMTTLLGKKYAENETSYDDLFQPWRILDIQMEGVEIENLTYPIEYNLEINGSSGYKVTCVFWDENCKI